MANDILGVSVTGLKLSQTALRTVGHNIANSGTEGYTRQRIDPTTNPAILSGRNYVGSGVNVNSIDRIVNQFVTEQVRTDSTLLNDMDVYFNQIRQLDNLLSDESTGLGASLNTFFSSMQNGADDPTSIPARQLIVSEAGNLADRFNTLYERMQVIESSVESGMEVAVSQINALAKNIAQLNFQIGNALGISNQAQPNDLLDQRDAALKELSGLVSTQVFDQGNGQVSVIIGTGQTLVLGKDARQLELATSAGNAAQQDVVFFDGKRREVVTQVITGGKLGGSIRFRDSTMADVYNQLGRVAVVMADTFNQAHQQGVNLSGEFGGHFFNDVNDEALARSRVVGNANNAAPNDRQLALYVRDSNVISTSDYELTVGNGGLYRITRLTDGTEVGTGVLSGRLPAQISFDGLELELQRGSFQNGDKFLLQPVRHGARDFSTVVKSAADLAFASPLLTDAALGNRGTGTISSGEVLALTSADGTPLPLFANAGSMSPPLLVVFNTPYSYDILDNSDPGNPVHLNPPLRDQPYVPGVTRNLFPVDPGGTLVTTNGSMMGLPEGRSPVTQAALLPGGSAPDFSVTDFSGSPFSFDLEITGSPNGVNDGTTTITINGAALLDDQSLLSHINSQLTSTNATAYIADDGSLAFRLRTPGYGNISLDNFAGAAGQANNLLGFDVEGSTFTTLGNADGVAGYGALTNGYPAEAITITRPSSTPGAAPVTSRIFTSMNASAKELANQLSSLPGVEANAFNYAEISDLQLTRTTPLQISLNGENLLAYSPDSVTGVPTLSNVVPDPVTDEDGFYDYLAESINSNSNLKQLGIYAVAGEDALTGARELRLYSSAGDDFQISLTAAAGESVDISDGDSSPLALTGAGNNVSSQIVVGGRLDVSLDEGISLGSPSGDSMIFGNTRAADFAQPTYMGIQVSISGTPQAGDRFSLDFNSDAASDNRNALNLVNLQQAKTTSGGAATFGQTYGTLVEKVGIETSAAKLNRNAAERVLQQSEEMRNSISGVNLDEEAADLIRFEQLFSANAQVISVARDIFDRLIGAF